MVKNTGIVNNGIVSTHPIVLFHKMQSVLFHQKFCQNFFGDNAL